LPASVSSSISSGGFFARHPQRLPFDTSWRTEAWNDLNLMVWETGQPATVPLMLAERM
jgi:hypothetical protein